MHMCLSSMSCVGDRLVGSAWKVLFRDSIGGLHTPRRGSGKDMPIGMVLLASDYWKYRIKELDAEDGTMYLNGWHCYENLSDAILCRDKLRNRSGSDYVIVKVDLSGKQVCGFDGDNSWIPGAPVVVSEEITIMSYAKEESCLSLSRS